QKPPPPQISPELNTVGAGDAWRWLYDNSSENCFSCKTVSTEPSAPPAEARTGRLLVGGGLSSASPYRYGDMKLLVRAGIWKTIYLASLLLGAAWMACACLATPVGLQSNVPTVYVEIPRKRLALNAAVAAGDVSMSLVGDSHTVTHVKLYLANETN